MSGPESWSRRILAMLALVCWMTATCVLLAIFGTVAPSPSEPGLSDDHGSLVARLFGSSRTILSRHLFLEADRYFHKGIRIRSERAFSNALLIQWADQIAPNHHEEVEGSAISEIMPWLQMSIASDPQNFEAWAAAGYWLLQQGNMTAAVNLMKDGQRQNLADYRFFSALGQLFFFNRDYLFALDELSRAQELWPLFKLESEEDHQRGMGEILTFQAGIQEAMGRRDAALEKYRTLFKMFPLRTHLSDRIAELEAGTENEDVHWVPPDHQGVHQHLLQFRGSASHVHHSNCTHD